MFNELIFYIYLLLFFSVPLASLVWFIVSLIKFIKCPKAEHEQRRSKIKSLVLSAIVCLFLCGGMIWLIVMFTLSLQHM